MTNKLKFIWVNIGSGDGLLLDGIKPSAEPMLTSPGNKFKESAQAAILFRNHSFNTLRPRQNGRHFTDDTFKHIFLNENVRISIKISLKLVTKGPINSIPAMVQTMAWRRSGDKPLSDPMMTQIADAYIRPSASMI